MKFLENIIEDYAGQGVGVVKAFKFFLYTFSTVIIALVIVTIYKIVS